MIKKEATKKERNELSRQKFTTWKSYLEFVEKKSVDTSRDFLPRSENIVLGLSTVHFMAERRGK